MRRYTVPARHECEPLLVKLNSSDQEQIQVDFSAWVEDNDPVTSVQLVSKSGNGSSGEQTIEADRPENLNIEYTVGDEGKSIFEILLTTQYAVKTIPIVMNVVNNTYTDDYGLYHG